MAMHQETSDSTIRSPRKVLRVQKNSRYTINSKVPINSTSKDSDHHRQTDSPRTECDNGRMDEMLLTKHVSRKLNDQAQRRRRLLANRIHYRMRHELVMATIRTCPIDRSLNNNNNTDKGKHVQTLTPVHHKLTMVVNSIPSNSLNDSILVSPKKVSIAL